MIRNAAMRVDDRWIGDHGIGRYAAEVLPRLTVDWDALGLTGSPSSPTDVFRRVHHDGPIYSPGYNVFLRGGDRQYVTIHDLIHLRAGGTRGAAYRAYYALARRVIRRSGLVFTVSRSTAREIRAWLGDDSVEIVVTRAGCSDEFRAAGEVPATRKPYFLLVGNLRPHKNVPTFLRALSRTDMEAAIVLPRREVPRLDALIAQHGLEGRVTAHSALPDAELASLYRGATATVLPSTMEGFGLPALESIRCGTPVIFWAGCESVAEIVGDQGQAVTDSNNAEEWAAALEHAVEKRPRSDPETVAAFTWTSVANRVDDALLGRLSS